jgi:hypothetical protein
MNPARHIRRTAAALVGLAAMLLVALGATPAFARLEPDQGAGYVGPVSDPARTIVAGGMPGWQIALIAVGAAVLAAALAVLADRALAARRQTVITAA